MAQLANLQRYTAVSFFFLEILAASKPLLLGLPGPHPAPFLSTAKEKGEKKRRKGLHAPLNPPVGLLAQKAARLQTVALTESGWPCSPCF